MNINLDTPHKIIIRNATNIDAVLRPTVYETCEVEEIIFHVKGMFILKAENQDRFYSECHNARENDISEKIGSLLYVNSKGDLKKNVVKTSLDEGENPTCRVCGENVEELEDIFHISDPVIDIESAEIHGSCFYRILNWIQIGWNDNTDVILVNSLE